MLAGRRVTAVLLSLPAAATLSAGPNVTVIIPGGTLRPGEGALTGPITESALRSLRVDTAVITCCGLSPADGIMAYDLPEASVKRTAMVSAQRTIVMAEAAKFSRSALAVVASLAEVDLLVTDLEAPAGAVEATRRLGVTVHQA